MNSSTDLISQLSLESPHVQIDDPFFVDPRVSIPEDLQSSWSLEMLHDMSNASRNGIFSSNFEESIIKSGVGTSTAGSRYLASIQDKCEDPSVRKVMDLYASSTQHDPKHGTNKGTTVRSGGSNIVGQSPLHPSSMSSKSNDGPADGFYIEDDEGLQDAALQKIGHGGFGGVFKGSWRGTDVAVKFLNDSDTCMAAFKDEAHIMHRLRHPNIVLFMGVLDRPGRPGLVSEFVPRGSLYSLLHGSRRERIDPGRRLKMAKDTAKGVNYLHSSSPPIVHRDLKSLNLLVTEDYSIKVCDFGLSRIKLKSFMTAQTNFTAHWTAPEVMRGEKCTGKSDIYSFGVILWELVTGEVPFGAMAPMIIMHQVGHNNMKPEVPTDIAPGVQDLIHACFSTTPADRPSFGEIIERLSKMSELRPSPSMMRGQSS